MSTDEIFWIIGGHSRKGHPVFFRSIEIAYYYNKYELGNTNPELLLEVAVDAEYIEELIELGNIIG